MSKKFYNICIIDDHQLIRDGVKLILKETSLYQFKIRIWRFGFIFFSY